LYLGSIQLREAKGKNSMLQGKGGSALTKTCGNSWNVKGKKGLELASTGARGRPYEVAPGEKKGWLWRKGMARGGNFSLGGDEIKKRETKSWESRKSHAPPHVKKRNYCLTHRNHCLGRTRKTAKMWGEPDLWAKRHQLAKGGP